MKNKWLASAIKANRVETILAVLFKILFAAFLVLVSYSLSYLLDSYNKGGNEFNQAILIVIGILVVTIIISFFSDYFKSRYIRKVNIYVRSQITKKIIGHSEDLISSKNTGKKISWYINDVDEIEEKYFENIIDVFYYAAMVIVAFVSVILLHWSLAAGALALLIISLFIPQIATNYITKAQEKLTQAKEVYTESVRDNLESLNTLFIANKLDYFQDRVTQQDLIRENQNYSYNLTSAKMNNIMIFISLLSQIGLTIFALYIASLGYTTEGSVLSIAALSGNLFNGVQGLIGSLSIFGSINAITDKYVFENDDNNKAAIEKIDSIELKNISFNYDEKNVFNNFNFTFNKQKYALLGASGSGKSTLLKILLGLLKVDKGEVLVNNQNIDQLNRESYFKNLAYIEQNVYLLNETIKENILLGSHISDEHLKQILDKANLTDLIQSLPNGINTKISSNGQEISGGEKQRIAIARALVKEVDFILVDESTSQLDAQNRADIEKILFELENVGVIMISHNFDEATLFKFDQVIDLNQR